MRHSKAIAQSWLLVGLTVALTGTTAFGKETTEADSKTPFAGANKDATDQASSQAKDAPVHVPAKPGQDLREKTAPLERKGTKAEAIPAGRPVNIGKQKSMQLPAPPDYFFINKLGKQTIPYTMYEASEFHEGLAAILIADQWGYMDKEGDVKIGANFDLASDFSDGLAPVKIKDKWGYVDHTSTFVIEPRFASAEVFKNGYAAVQLSKDSPEFPQKAERSAPIDFE